MSFKKTVSLLTILLSLVYLIWWVWLAIFVSPESDLRNGYSLSYGVIAGFGGIVGFIIARKWDGFKSDVGRSLIFFSFGLFCQFLGQLSYSIQFLIDSVNNSYPGVGEIFFMLSMPSYILGVWYIAKSSGFIISLKSFKNIMGAIIFPLIMVVISYYLFIQGTDFSQLSLSVKILTCAYPIGQAVFVSFAILAYYLSGKVLGGMMKKRVFFILFSLVFQYCADSWFLYLTINEKWYHADVSEFLFAASYSLMTIAFIQFLTVFEQLKKGSA